MKNKYIIIFLILCLYASNSFSQNTESSYKLKLNIIEQIDENFVKADFNYIIEISANEGFFCIPLPFGMKNGSNFIVDPTSSNNLILTGFIRPENNYGILQITSRKYQTTKLNIAFKNITIPISQTSISKDQMVANLIFTESINEIRSQNPIYKIINPTEIVIYSDSFINSNPSPKIAEREGENIVTIPKDFDIENQGIIIYLSKEKKRVSLFLIIFLLITGCLLGIFTAPKISTTFVKALMLGIFCLVIIIGTPIIINSYILPLNEISDTTTIVTLGTLIGIFIGLLLYSVKVVYNYYKSKKEIN